MNRAAGLTAPLLPTFALAQTRKESSRMSVIKVGQENSTPIEIYYEDVELKGASHGLTWTRADEINAELVPFLAW
jgi:hypothetical protein